MRFVTSVLAGLGLIACGDGGSNASAEAHRLVDEGATLVDVRTEAEFNNGHIEGAINIPVHELPDRQAEIPQDHPVVVYCRSGGRSSTAAHQLQSAGYEVFDLGPMSAWEQAP